ncbi:MAG TPA: hypothetical protein DDW55_07440 [Gammaproteobacteria bacterium]|nr:hypothetical protein [Gammaproteobacteria bacterium]
MTVKPLLMLFFFTLAMLLAGCHEPNNPLLGNWQHTEPNGSGVQEIVKFTPSTMVIGGQRVTVVYQIRPDKIRVSASKRAIVYDLIDEQTISYEDDDKRKFTLIRVAEY